MLPVSGNKANLYKYMFPPGLERPTLVVIGLVQPLGAIMPISEMQARWATRVFKGTSLLFYQTLAHLFNFPHSLSLFVLFPQAYLCSEGTYSSLKKRTKLPNSPFGALILSRAMLYISWIICFTHRAE